MEFQSLTVEEQLRLGLVEQTEFALNEILLVLRFIKGDDSALEELQEFREWKEEQAFKKMLPSKGFLDSPD